MPGPEDAPAANSDIVNGAPPAAGPGEAQDSRPELLSNEDFSANNLTGPEISTFTGLFDDLGQYIWPNPNMDLGLDQGWNLN